MTDETITSLGFSLREAKDRKESLEAALKEVNKEIKEIAEIKLPGIMQNQEIDSVRIPGVGTIFLKQDVHVSINEGMKEGAYGWLAENGHGDMIKDYVHPATLKAWAKEQLENNMPIPEEIRAYYATVAQLRRS
jgi:hypothetical protein